MRPFQCQRKEPDRTFIRPGFGLIPNKGDRLWTVTGSGVVLTLYDAKRELGGMSHYYRPFRMQNYPSTAVFAAPAIFWLLQEFQRLGSVLPDLEAQLIGGAANLQSPGFQPGLAEQNVAVGLELLEKKAVKIGNLDVGGKRGRKIAFNCQTGETAIARVDLIREEDWYPKLRPLGK